MFTLSSTPDVTALAFSPDGRTLAAFTTPDTEIEFWDLTERQCWLAILAPRPVSRLTFSPAGDALLVAERNRLFFCPLPDWLRSRPRSSPSQIHLDELAGRFQSFSHPTRVIVDLLWQPDGQVVEIACYREEAGKLGADLWHWNPSTRTANVVLKENTGRSVCGLGLSPTRPKTLAVACYFWKYLRLVREDGVERVRLPFELVTASPVFASDGRTLALLRDKSVVLLDVATRRIRATLAAEGRRINAAAFTPDSRLTLTGNQDGTVALWDTLTGAPRGRFEWDIGPVQALVVSADGMLAAAAGRCGRIVVWDVDAG